MERLHLHLDTIFEYMSQLLSNSQIVDVAAMIFTTFWCRIIAVNELIKVLKDGLSVAHDRTRLGLFNDILVEESHFKHNQDYVE